MKMVAGACLNREWNGKQPRSRVCEVKLESSDGLENMLPAVEENQGIMDCSVLVVELVGDGGVGICSWKLIDSWMEF